MIDLQKKQQLLNNMRILTNYIIEFEPFTSCLDCANWNEKRERCTKFDMVPPPKIIVKKCEDFEPDIPFQSGIITLLGL